MTKRDFQRYFSGLSSNTFLLALVLPIFLTQILNASGSVVGLVEGIAGATQNIVQGLSGFLSDRLQRRKSIALAGYFLAAIAKPLIGLSTVWQGVFGARLLDRLGAGTRSAPRDALIASSVDEHLRGKAFGLEGIGDNTGAFVGPLFTIFLLYSLHVGIRTIFYLAIIPGLLAFVMVLLVTERRAAVTAKSKMDVNRRQFPSGYWKYLSVIALFGLGNSSNSFLILRTQDIGAPLETTILMYALFNLAAALISYPAGSFSDKLGRKNVLLASFLIFALTYIGFAYAQNVLIFAALFIFYGLYQGIFRAVGKAFASDFVPENLRASGVGWYSSTVGLLELVASVVAGLLWDRVGHAAVFYYGAAFGLAGSIGLIVLIPKRDYPGAARSC